MQKQGFYASQKPPSSHKSGKKGRPPNDHTQPPNDMKPPRNNTIPPPNALQVPPNRECAPKVSYVQACQVSTHLKRPLRSFHLSPKAPRSFQPRHTPRFLHAQMSLSSFHIPTKAPRSFTKAQSRGFHTRKTTSPSFHAPRKSLKSSNAPERTQGFPISI